MMRVYKEEVFTRSEGTRSRPVGRSSMVSKEYQRGQCDWLGTLEVGQAGETATSEVMPGSSNFVFLGRRPMAFMVFLKGSMTLTQFRRIPQSMATFGDSQTSLWMLKRTSEVSPA